MNSGRKARLFFLLIAIASQLFLQQSYAGGRKPLAFNNYKTEIDICSHGTNATSCGICGIIAYNNRSIAYNHTAKPAKNNFVLTSQSYDPSQDEENGEEEEDPIPEDPDPNEFPWGWIVAGTWLLWFIAKGNNKA